MKKSTFESRIAKANLKTGSINLRLLTEVMETGSCRPCTVKGSGRYIHNDDRTYAICDLLRLIGLKSNDFEVNNDAKLGGLAGNIIQLTSSGKRKMIK